MVLKRSLAAFMLAALLVSTFAFAFAATASADSDASAAVDFCRELDEAGELEEAGVTFGECVNIIKGPSSENANNFVAGLCGLDEALVLTGTTNKGQCIKALRDMV